MRKEINIEIAIFCAVFLAMLLMSSLTPMLADDYSYSFSYAVCGKRIQNLQDIIRSLAAHREKMNGRMFSHGLAMLFLILPKPVFNIFNATNAVFMLFFIAKYYEDESKKKNLCLLIATVFLLWIFTPVFGQVFLWLDGALNYSWAISVILVFLHPYLCVFMERECLPNKRKSLRFPYCILAFVAGGYSENASCAALLMAGCFLLFSFRKKKQIPRYLIISFLAACAGFLFMMTAPAESGRAAETDLLIIAKNIQRVFEAPQKTILPLYCLFAAALAIGIVKKIGSEQIAASLIFFIGSVASVLVFALAVYFPWRSLFATTVYLLISCMILLKEIWKKENLIVPVLTSVLGVCFLFSFVLGLGDISVLYMESRERERILRTAAAENIDPVYIHQYSSNTKYAASYLLPDVYEDAAQWPNYDIAAYYGVGEVIGLPAAENFGE